MRDTGALEHELDALLQPLVEKGYISYTNEEKSGIVPTGTSKRILAQLWSVVEHAEKSVLAGFSEQEKAQFREFLKRIQENCARVVEELYLV